MAYLGNYGGTFQSDFASLTRLATSGDFSAYLQQRIFEESRMVRSGVLMRADTLLTSTTGTRVEAPFFRPIDPVEERMTSGSNWGTSGLGFFTPQSITGATQYATITHRGFAYAADKLARLATGEDPMRAVADQLVPALDKLKTRKAVAHLEGLLGTGGVLNSTHNLNKSATSSPGEANYLRAGAIVEARYKLGARQSDITTIFIPPPVAASLEVLGFLAYDGDRAGVNRRQSIGIFGDLQVIVDDQLPIIGTTGQARQFVCYLCGPGVLLEGDQTPIEIEFGRNPLSKQDVMVVDYHHAQHVAGTSWASATDNPTNTQLATPANYSLAYSEPRLIPAVRLVVNSEFGGLVP